MRADYKVFIDACVLANFGVCNLLLRLSEKPRLILPHWSPEVLSEVRRVHQKLGWPEHLIESFPRKLAESFPEAEVTGYESLIGGLTNDEGDRHVLAAAIRGSCPLIITFNLKHFPDESLRPWGIKACHPQEYLLVLYEMVPAIVTGCLGEIAGRRGLDIEDVLIKLGASVPAFSTRLLDERNA